MNVARPSDGLLPAKQTLRLVELLSRRLGGAAEDQIIRDLAASTPISWARARNTIHKLSGYGVISKLVNHPIRLAIQHIENVDILIADRVANELIDRLGQEKAWSCVRLDPVNESITIDALTLPAMTDGLGMWLTEFGIAARERAEARYWQVTERHRRAFLSGARNANTSRPRVAKSAQRLAADLARQAEDGKAAEEWVLQYERERLRDHPLCDQIRRVSEDDVGAGYDVLSFSSRSSLQHDLFIEVKSHGIMKLFHWSRNEIATAEEFGEEYALYLVDRTRMSDADYRPHIISAPTPEMFAQPGSGWKVEATSFEHIATHD